MITRARLIELFAYVLAPVSLIVLFFAATSIVMVGSLSEAPNYSHDRAVYEVRINTALIGVAAAVFVAACTIVANAVRSRQRYLPAGCSVLTITGVAFYFGSFFGWRTAAYQSSSELERATLWAYVAFGVFLASVVVAAWLGFREWRSTRAGARPNSA